MDSLAAKSVTTQEPAHTVRLLFGGVTVAGSVIMPFVSETQQTCRPLGARVLACQAHRMEQPLTEFGVLDVRG